jgi:hypothetical protein
MHKTKTGAKRCFFYRKVQKKIHIVPFVDGSRYKMNGPVTTTEFRMHRFNDRVREVPKISPDIWSVLSTT